MAVNGTDDGRLGVNRNTLRKRCRELGLDVGRRSTSGVAR